MQTVLRRNTTATPEQAEVAPAPCALSIDEAKAKLEMYALHPWLKKNFEENLVPDTHKGVDADINEVKSLLFGSKE